MDDDEFDTDDLELDGDDDKEFAADDEFDREEEALDSGWWDE